MQKVNINRNKDYGDEAPRLKDFIIVLAVLLALMALSWLMYCKFHWFH